ALVDRDRRHLAHDDPRDLHVVVLEQAGGVIERGRDLVGVLEEVDVADGERQVGGEHRTRGEERHELDDGLEHLPPHRSSPPTRNLMVARVVPGLDGSGSVPAASPSTWKNWRRPLITAGSWLRLL